MEENVKQRVDLIKSRVTIYDALAIYGEIHTPQGTPHQISCPFRQLNHGKGTDAHRSARIYPRTNSFHCWACNANGDVIWLVQTMQGFKTCEETCDYLETKFKLVAEKKDLTQKFLRTVKRFVKKRDQVDEGKQKLDSLRHVLDLELAGRYQKFMASITDLEVLLVDATFEHYWERKKELDDVSENSFEYEKWAREYFDWYNSFRNSLNYYENKARVKETLGEWKKQIEATPAD